MREETANTIAGLKLTYDSEIPKGEIRMSFLTFLELKVRLANLPTVIFHAKPDVDGFGVTQ